jgi:predicted small lipoprotein YifL
MKKSMPNAEATLSSQKDIMRLSPSPSGRRRTRRRAPRAISFLHDLCESFADSALSHLKVAAALALAVSLAGCGTKTELLKPSGKPTPHDERDPSQPPSPISR